MKRTVLATLLTIVLSAGILRAESVRTLNNEGVEAYERGDYQDAENLFDQAREKKPEDLRIQYNRGAALAGSDDLEGALDAFARVSGARDEEIARRADFSRGVAFLKQAQAKAGQQDMDGAIKSAQAAEEANKVVLLQTPQDEDARINFEIAHRLRKQLEEVRQQEQQQKDQQQENQQEDQQQDKQEQQEESSQQDQQKSEEENKNQESQQEDQQQESQSESHQNQQQGNESQDQDPDADQARESAQEQQEELRDASLSILNLLDENDEAALKRMLQQRFRGTRQPEKNW